MAAHLAPTRVRSEHQRLHHFVADAAWSDYAVLAAVRDYVLEQVVARAGRPEALLIDDSGFPKQGRHSVPRYMRCPFDSLLSDATLSPAVCLVGPTTRTRRVKYQRGAAHRTQRSFDRRRSG